MGGGSPRQLGTFRLPIRIGPLDGTIAETIEAVVDTGATYTWIPRPVLDRLGIRSIDTRRIQMADGRVIDREIASLLVAVDGKTVPTLCVFGDATSTALLGAVTLEECGLAPDPVAQRLIPVIGYALAGHRVTGGSFWSQRKPHDLAIAPGQRPKRLRIRAPRSPWPRRRRLR